VAGGGQFGGNGTIVISAHGSGWQLATNAPFPSETNLAFTPLHKAERNTMIVNMACPKCGGQATEYDEKKWSCLRCPRKFSTADRGIEALSEMWTTVFH